MTAVAPPLTFQPSTRIGWTSNGNGFGAANSEEVSKMFTPAPRKTAQRQNSSSSISSTASSNSSTSTVPASPVQTNGAAPAGADSASWAARKKPTRGLWPAGKAEPATGITTARPQTVNSATSGPSASSAISALHTAPMLPSQQMANGTAQSADAPATPKSDTLPILHLIPINGTFERKKFTVPFHPEVMRIGRQTNQKTIPARENGYFDSKVLSRQHAEVYADRQGHVYIRDVKSSNGTFVNGMRLSQENKESEPRELHENDVLELGIDIVSEDQRTVVHHKVAARVEHAGIYERVKLPPIDYNAVNSGNSNNPLIQAIKRGNQNSLAPGAGQAAMNAMNQPQHMRNWLNPITTEHIVKKLNAEMKFAQQQAQDLARARQTIEAMLGGKLESPAKESKPNSEKSRPSPIKSKTDLKAHFSEPPAPPPSAPLPEKPDVARALADPLIQPLLRRNDTARPPSGNSSPTRTDHSSDILRLCEELKLAKSEISNQGERMRSLENELAQERTARESAEERAQKLEQVDRRDSSREGTESIREDDSPSREDHTGERVPDLRVQLDRLRVSMDEMKQHMEAYRKRAETAEAERDEARQSLADMVDQKRKRNAQQAEERPALASTQPKVQRQVGRTSSESNGHPISPTLPLSPTSEALLERAGVEEGRPITPEQAKILTQFLTQEILVPQGANDDHWLRHYGMPYSFAVAVMAFGAAAMLAINAWEKVER